jgi:hypothetical protein
MTTRCAERRIAGREAKQEEHQRHHAGNDTDGADRAAGERKHACNLPASA